MLLRAEITKGEQVRFISHLDFARTVERGLRRAQIPVAYSEGFNPHVKLAFASALSVGVSGKREYFDIELAEDMEPRQFSQQVASSLPDGITVGRAIIISDRHKALMAVVNYATYIAHLPLSGEIAQADAAVEQFNKAASVSYTRHSPKGRREFDLKQYIPAPVMLDTAGNTLVVSFGIAITPGGSAKASELVEALADQFALPANRELALICREGLWVKQGDHLISPLELKG